MSINDTILHRAVIKTKDGTILPIKLPVTSR